MRWVLVVLGLALSGCCCFLYPGEGQCDPATFVNHCDGSGTAVNCTNVTPVGYGLGIVPRHAELRAPCLTSSVCVVVNAEATCVVDPPTTCADDGERRCVDGSLHQCSPVGSFDFPVQLRWVDLGPPCDDAGVEPTLPSQ